MAKKEVAPVMGQGGMPVTGPRNPFLADSCYAIAHGRSDQQDNSSLSGPTGPSAVLGDGDLSYVWLGPGHFGGLISSRYPDGRRVIWSNGREQIVKLDYETLEVVAALEVPGTTVTPISELEVAIDGLDRLRGQAAIEHALGLGLRYMTGLDGVYAVLDRDNTLFLGRTDGVVAYRDVDATDPRSAIVERSRWVKPDEIAGAFVGLNMTFDGHLVLTTDHGWVVSVARDFSVYDTIPLRHSDIAAEWCAEQYARRGNSAYGLGAHQRLYRRREWDLRGVT